MSEPARPAVLATTVVDSSVGRVRVARLGEGSCPPLVFVHGYPDNLQIWSRLATDLAASGPVIAFDWPGLGWSDEIVDGATPFHLGRHLVAVLDALGVDEAVPVGFDMGGHAVVAAASAQPERFTRIVLTNFLALGDVRTSWDIVVMRRLGLNRLILRRLPRIVFRRAERSFLTGHHRLDPAVRSDLVGAFARPEVRRRLVKMSAGYQASLPRIARLYPELHQPALVLWADRDPHFPLIQATTLVGCLPAAQLEVLDGLSHWFMWEAPARAATAIEAFAR